jgi:hypothetical protein
MKWKRFTLSGKIIFFLFIINLFSIIFGIVKVTTLGENTYYPSATSSWYDLLFRMVFISIFISIVIIYYGYFFYSKKTGMINFFTKIGFVSLMLSGFLFYLVFLFGLLG